MSHTNTDYLFQTLAAGASRVPSVSRADDGAGFDGHLSQASTSVFDAVHAARKAEPPAAPVRSHDDGPRSLRKEDSGSSDYDDEPSAADGGDARPAASTNHSPPAESPCAADDNGTSRSGARDNCDDATESADAGAAGAQSTPTLQTNQERAKASAEEAAAVAGKTQSGNGIDVPLTTTTTAEAPTNDARPTVLEAVAANGEQSPTAESKNNRRNNGAKAGHADGTGKEPMTADERSQANAASQNAAEAVKLDELGPATDNVEAANRKPAKNDTTESDDEAGHGSKSTNGANDRNDAVSPTKNSPTAVGVAANLPSLTDSAAAKPNESKSAMKPVKGHTDTSIGPLGRAMRAATELARGAQSGGSEETPQVDPTRFVGRVAKAFHTAQERGGVLQLRLSPPELGSLKLQLVVKDGVLSASLETDNAHARRVLLDHLPALRDRLAEQNIRVERFDVDVQQENTGGQANPHGSNQNPYQQQPDQSASRRGPIQPQPSEAMPEPLAAAAPRIGATEINLIV